MSFLAELIEIVLKAVEGVTRHAHRFAATVALKAAMIFSGFILLVGAAALLIAAFYLSLAPPLGPIPALLLCAAATILFASVLLVIALWPR